MWLIVAGADDRLTGRNFNARGNDVNSECDLLGSRLFVFLGS
jgi:hypothetical protein